MRVMSILNYCSETCGSNGNFRIIVGILQYFLNVSEVSVSRMAAVQLIPASAIAAGFLGATA